MELSELVVILMKCIPNSKKYIKAQNSSLKNAVVFTDPRIFSNFENPLHSFPIAAVHGILDLREKLLDRIPMKLLGKEEYTRFEKDFIISLVGPRQQYHGGSYTGDKSKKLIDSFSQINLNDFPSLEPLIPVLESASNLIHTVFGKILLEGWQNSIHEFRNSYGDMQQKVVEILNKSVAGGCGVGIEREFEQLHLHSTKSIPSKLQSIRHNLTPSTKLHILLDHLEEFLLLVNTNRPDSQPLGLGYFAESVLESSHHTFKDLSSRFHGANKLLRTVVEFNAQSIGYLRENISRDSLSLVE